MDAVSHEYNGTLIEPKDVEQLVSIMKCYKNNHEQRTNHGQNGLKWVQNFKQQVIWHGLNQLYLDDV